MLLAQDLDLSRQKRLKLNLGRFVLDFSERTLVMGILNLTPDSFYDGGIYTNKRDAVNRVFEMAEVGADIIDIGGQSTRPGSDFITTEEELDRVLPVVDEAVKQINIPMSIDTCNHIVADECLRRGVALVNDITGLKGDMDMADVISKHKAGVILMHIKGTPKDMQKNIAYTDLMQDVMNSLSESIRIAFEAGISHDKMIVDPGIGFSKTREHNLAIINSLSRFKRLKKPIMIGVSRKSFIGDTLKLNAGARLLGTAACVAISIANGANIVRVHDVAEIRQVTKMTDAILREGSL